MPAGLVEGTLPSRELRFPKNERSLQGGHVFVSNWAALGVDRRLSDDRVGHTTEGMRQRYRHLLPSRRQDAARLVLGA